MHQLAPQQNGSPITMMFSDVDINPHERYAQLLETFDHLRIELQQAREERDEARTDLILHLHDQGYTVRGIAAEVGDISKTLVQNTITANRPMVVPHEGFLTVPIEPQDPKSWNNIRGCEFEHHLNYVLKDAEGQVLYVGCTDSPKYRWGEHRRNRTWWHEVVSADFVCFGERSEALANELVLIKRLQPLYNIKGFGRSPRKSRKRSVRVIKSGDAA